MTIGIEEPSKSSETVERKALGRS